MSNKAIVEFEGPYHPQGDLNIFACNEIPKDLAELKAEKGVHVLAHSESGHNHVIDGNTVRVFKQDDFISYLDVQKKSNVIHLRGFDTHKTISLPPGKYRIARQREYIPEGYRKAQD